MTRQLRVVRIAGGAGKRTYVLGPIHADQLGLYAHPDHAEQLLLKEGADPDVEAHFPNGAVLRAAMFPLLASQALDDYGRGWLIDTCDPGRMPVSTNDGQVTS